MTPPSNVMTAIILAGPRPGAYFHVCVIKKICPLHRVPLVAKARIGHRLEKSSQLYLSFTGCYIEDSSPAREVEKNYQLHRVTLVATARIRRL